jgi:phage N-6-adenine-methyltransferase
LNRLDRLKHQARTDPRQHARTPLWLFEALHRRFRFTVDAACDASNQLLSRGWTADDDFLTQSWERHRVFLNPPFCLASKAIETATSWAGLFRVPSVLLLPAKTCGAAVAEAVANGASIGVFRKRVNYEPAPGVKFSTANRDSMLLVFGFEDCGIKPGSTFVFHAADDDVTD